MKIYVLTDLEGASGVVNFEDQVCTGGKYYEQAKKLLTNEVNGAIEGMLTEKVTDIFVFDGHGVGGVSLEDLHPEAKFIHGQPPLARALNEIVSTCDAAIVIGQHAMAGNENGCLNHTQCYDAVEYYKLNDKYIGEIGQYSLLCGALDVPVIFLSGDDAACREVEELIPGITTTAVKRGLNRKSAISYPPAKSRQLVRQGMEKAIKKYCNKPASPLKWPGPFVLEKRFTMTGLVDAYKGHSLARIIDAKTVQLRSDNILDIIYA